MHGLRLELLNEQLNAIGIPNGTLNLSENPTNVEYEKRMGESTRQLKNDGFEYAAFGDIFLEDLRKYRKQQLRQSNLKTVFPIWGKDTRQLIHQFIDMGFKAVVVAVNASALDQSFAGRVLDKQFVNDLPKEVDPCGENGESHTFCFDAPYFKHPIHFSLGETVFKEYTHNGQKSGFWFCDLILEKDEQT